MTGNGNITDHANGNASVFDIFEIQDTVSLSKPRIENLLKLENQSEPWLLLFYDPWCYFCREIEGCYVELAENLDELWHESCKIKGRCTVVASKVKSLYNLSIKYLSEKRDIDSMLAFMNAPR
ncbi:hypothetical protein BC332_03445 [Capsicum chinense]|nr:hypothetical protein BC332_03445 [Capsicum chinense]